MLSLIFPIYNRADLFKPTLEALAQQHYPRDEYEILVIDDGSTDHLQKLCRTFRTIQELPLRYCKIDVWRLPFEIFAWNGANNPAPAINVGIRGARFPRIVLSSPEIVYTQATNLLRMATWPLAEHEALIGNVWDESMRDHPELQGYISGGPRQRYLHFLGVFPTAQLRTIGGMEEAFIEAWGAEDAEFTERWLAAGGTYLFAHQSVTATHQWHPRPYWGETPGEEGVLDAVKRGDRLCDAIRADPARRLQANIGRPWGSTDLIVEREGW